MGVAEEDEPQVVRDVEKKRCWEHGQGRAGEKWAAENLKNFGAQKIFMSLGKARD